jgi:O-antigen ligase
MRTIAFSLSLMLVFTIPWENAITLGELGTLARAIGMLAAGFWAGSALLAGRFRRPHPFHMVIFLFVLWNIASFFWSTGSDETFQRIKTYGQVGILAWMLWDLYTTPKALRAALEAYILGAYVTIGSTVFNYLTGREISVYEEGRYAGSGLNAGDLALILALGLPVAWHLATSVDTDRKNRFLQLLNYAYIPASLFTISLTGSRMALFTIIPVILYAAGTFKRLKPSFRIFILASLIGCLFALQTHIPQPTLDRLATTRDSIAKEDLGGRVKLWGASIAIFFEHPFLGVGSGMLHNPKLLGAVAHNTFLSVLAELGLIGFLLFGFILVIVVHEALKQPKSLSGLWLTILAVWAIGASALTWEFTKQTWFFLSLVLISASLSNGPDNHMEDRVLSVKPPDILNSSDISEKKDFHRARSTPQPVGRGRG